jgi:iron(III) transport system ATP-binding protein
MSAVAAKALTKRFGAFTAIQEVDLDVQEGEFVTLLGPSGCGKTTTLRCLAGLEVPTAGEIAIGGRVVACPERSVFVPPNKRSIGMVFQSYALWPHMTVRGNVGYPLKLARVPRAERRVRVREILELVGLADRTDHMAVSLSGGQQQRVALARALVNRPALLLFDEPLSNLDAKLRTQMREQIRDLHDTAGATSVYVTHDQEEAIALADRIVVMRAGRIEQVGTPRALYTAPASRFVADFMGFQNILDGRVREVRGGELVMETDTGGLRVTATGPAPGPAGTGMWVAFRAAHLGVAVPGEAAATTLRGTVTHATYLGSAVRILLDAGGLTLRAQLDEDDLARLGGQAPHPGTELTLTLPPDRVVALPDEVEAEPKVPLTEEPEARSGAV